MNFPIIRKICAVLFLICTTCLLIACDQNAGDPVSAPRKDQSVSAAVTPSPSAKQIHLTALVWAPDWPQEMLQIAAAFQRQHPHISVDVQFMIGNSVEENLKPKIASQNLPDIISINPNTYSAGLAEQGILIDLDKTAAWNNMLPSLKRDWTSQHGHKYGISGGVAATLIYYNQEMFQRAGITQLPRNFDEFLEVCAALKKAGFTPIVWTGAFPNTLANGPFSFGFANAIAARYPHDWKNRLNEGRLRFNNTETEEIFSRIKVIADKGYVQHNFMNTGYDEGIRLFTEGKVAMVFQGTWSSGELMQGKDFKTGVMMPPWNAAGKTIVPVVGSETGFAVCDTPRQQAALQFLEYIYGAGYSTLQNKRQNIPPMQHVQGNVISNSQLLDYVDHAMHAPLTVAPYYSYLPTNTLDLLHSLLQDVLLNKKTPRQAATLLDASIRRETKTENQ